MPPCRPEQEIFKKRLANYFTASAQTELRDSDISIKQ